jgi:hypothetical protein
VPFLLRHQHARPPRAQQKRVVLLVRVHHVFGKRQHDLFGVLRHTESAFGFVAGVPFPQGPQLIHAGLHLLGHVEPVHGHVHGRGGGVVLVVQGGFFLFGPFVQQTLHPFRFVLQQMFCSARSPDRQQIHRRFQMAIDQSHAQRPVPVEDGRVPNAVGVHAQWVGEGRGHVLQRGPVFVTERKGFLLGIHAFFVGGSFFLKHVMGAGIDVDTFGTGGVHQRGPRFAKHIHVPGGDLKNKGDQFDEH